MAILQGLQKILQLDLFSEFLQAQPVAKPSGKQAGLSPKATPSKPQEKQILPQLPSDHANKTARIREILLDNQLVQYELRRSKRRSIGFQINPQGLRVSIPNWLTIAETEDALRSKQSWILTKLSEFQGRQAQRQAQQTRWEIGAEISYLGLSLRIQHQQSKLNRVIYQPDEASLTLCHQHAAPTSQAIQFHLERWLKQQALKRFHERASWYANQLGVSFHSLSLSSAKGRWGSCSSDKKIRLQWSLIQFAPELSDYVIAHEIAHLVEMNHSARFWAVVERLYPDYQAARERLRAHAPAQSGEMC